MADDPGRPSPALLPSAITGLVHAGVWAAAIAFALSSLTGPFPRFQDDFQMKLPWLTETVLQAVLWIRDYLPVVIGVLAVLVLADIAILHALSRTDERRGARELWSGIIIALGVTGLYITATA